MATSLNINHAQSLTLLVYFALEVQYNEKPVSNTIEKGPRILSPWR